ncbi:MAG: antibiotic biosynthesis monooxygenase [Desulfobacterales bacterium]|nr:antibiotic biosynthesis monooxygenase [Desulfobacterales bacterium]
MKISAVTVRVKKTFVNDFIEASKIHQANTIKEEGNLRFDFLQSLDDPTLFLFYEAYRSQADIELHRNADSYRTWRQAVDPWMSVPRVGVGYRAVAPDEGDHFRYP